MRSTDYERERLINRILMDLDLTYLEPRILALPIQAWVRISTACDLRCPLCERQHVTPVDSGFMDFDRFAQMAAQMAGVHKAHLFGLGEPFLNKRFFDYVERYHAVGVEVSTTTHALLIDDDLARRILNSGIEEIAISMDAAEPELFDRLREGADFDAVCRNVKRLVQLKQDRRSALPDLLICCTVSSENVHQLAAMVELADRLGVRRVSFGDLMAPTREHEHYCVSGSPLVEEHFQMALVRGKQLGVEVAYFKQNTRPWVREEIASEGKAHGCAMAWTNLVVERQGGTKFCCYIKEPCPSAFDRPFEQVMNSEEHVRMRTELTRGDPRTECRGCPYLFVNSPEHVERMLSQVERAIGNSQLPESDRSRLTQLLLSYREKARERFSPDATASGNSPLRRLARRILPTRVRSAIRSILPSR